MASASSKLTRISDINIKLPEPRVLILDDDRDYLEATAKNLSH